MDNCPTCNEPTAKEFPDKFGFGTGKDVCRNPECDAYVPINTDYLEEQLRQSTGRTGW